MIIIIAVILNASRLLALEGNEILKSLGEKEYLSLKAKSTLPQHGICWYNALKSLKSSCENLNDHEHSILALKLANCFLEDSGHSSYNCHLSKSENIRRECINNMSDRAFGVYNEFYTHATHICFFLNYEAWQAETESIVKLLYQASTRMKEQLLEASEMQGTMLASQKEGLRLQNEILDHGKVLGNVLKSSSETVNNMVTEMKESTQNQKELLFEIFSYIRTFQNWIIGEVSWFQSIIYYTISCILCAVFTSSKRTIDGRMILFTILSLNIVIERMIVQYYDNIIHHSTNNKVEIVYMIWLVRKICLTLCGMTLLCTYYFYKDEQLENYRILKRIEHKINIIQANTLLCDEETCIKPIRCSRRLAIKRLQTVSVKQSNENHK